IPFDTTQQSIRAGRHGESPGQSRPRLAAEGETDRTLDFAQATRHLSVSGGERQALGKGPLRAARVVASESPDVDADTYLATPPGEVGDRADVSAVDLVRRHSTSRAIGRPADAFGVDLDDVRNEDQAPNRKSTVSREELGDVHDAAS